MLDRARRGRTIPRSRSGCCSPRRSRPSGRAGLDLLDTVTPHLWAYDRDLAEAALRRRADTPRHGPAGGRRRDIWEHVELDAAPEGLGRVRGPRRDEPCAVLRQPRGRGVALGARARARPRWCSTTPERCAGSARTAGALDPTPDRSRARSTGRLGTHGAPPAGRCAGADSIRVRGTTGRDRGPRRGRQAHAHRPPARRPGRARRRHGHTRLPALRRRRARRAGPRRPATAGSATSPTRCTRWRCCSRWTAGPRRPGSGRRWPSTTSSLVDRYVASNAAYGAARLHQNACGEFVAWVRDLEIDRFDLPVPDRHLLLDVPRAVAAERAAHRERTEQGRERDRYESDAGLQDRTGAVYRGARGGGLARAVDGARRSRGVDVEALSDALLH